MLKNKKVLGLLLVLIVVGLFFVFKDNKGGNDKGNTLSIAVMGEPSSLDPHYATGGVWEQSIMQDAYAGLFDKAANGDAILNIAESYEVSEGGKRYIFKLRDSKWSDGTPVTAHDFEYSYKRMLDPKVASGYAYFLWVLKNGEKYNSGQISADEVGVKALDDKTLQMDLEYPAGFFTTMLTHFIFYPVPKHIVEKSGRDWTKTSNMVSNGAYRILEWKSKSHVKATKNEYFWDAENTKIENVIYYTQEDRAAVLKRFRAGEIDIADDFASDQYEWLKTNMPDETRVSPYNAVFYLTLNIKHKALSDRRVREALAMSIDRDFITDRVLKTGEVPTYSMIPLGLDGYKPAEFSWKNLDKEERLKKAKELLKEAGYDEDHPLKLELAYTIDDNDKKVVVAISSMWKELGVETSTIVRENTVHYVELQKHEFDVGRARWVGDFEEASTYLDLFLTNSGYNYGLYKSARFDDLVKQGKETIDRDKRNRLYYQAENLMLHDVASIPIFYFVTKNLVNSRVEGWEANIGNRHVVRFLSLKD